MWKKIYYNYEGQGNVGNVTAVISTSRLDQLFEFAKLAG